MNAFDSTGRALALGQRVRVSTGTEEYEATVTDLHEDGAYVVEDSDTEDEPGRRTTPPAAHVTVIDEP